MGHPDFQVVCSVLFLVVRIDDSLKSSPHFFANYLPTFANKYSHKVIKSTKNEALKPRFLYPRRESNPNYKFRKLMFYPLNYKGLPLFYLNYYSPLSHCMSFPGKSV